jgi:hypothetical protein
MPASRDAILEWMERELSLTCISNLVHLGKAAATANITAAKQTHPCGRELDGSKTLFAARLAWVGSGIYRIVIISVKAKCHY